MFSQTDHWCSRCEQWTTLDWKNNIYDWGLSQNVRNYYYLTVVQMRCTIPEAVSETPKQSTTSKSFIWKPLPNITVSRFATAYAYMKLRYNEYKINFLNFNLPWGRKWRARNQGILQKEWEAVKRWANLCTFAFPRKSAATKPRTKQVKFHSRQL